MEPLDLDLATLAWLAGSAANERLLAAVRAAGHPGLRNAHGYVFQHLVDRSPTVGELAVAMGISQQAVSKTVVELERLGYVRRRSDPADRRVRQVELTRRGSEAIEAGRAARARLDADLEAELGKATMTRARAALAALLHHSGGADDVRARRARPPSS